MSCNLYDSLVALRARFLPFVAAHRSLSSPLATVETAVRDLEVERGTTGEKEREKWRDVMVGGVGGGGVEGEVDEFGRDLGRAEEKRREKELRTLEGKYEGMTPEAIGSLDESNDLDESGVGGTDFSERRWCLKRALEVAVQDIEPTYLSLSNLVGIFSSFRASHPTEYEQAYGGELLKGMAETFVRMEIVSSFDPCNVYGIGEGGGEGQRRVEGMEFFKVLEEFGGDREGGGGMVGGLVEKVVAPALAGALEDGYDMGSTKETAGALEYAKSVMEKCGEEGESEVWRAVVANVKRRCRDRPTVHDPPTPNTPAAARALAVAFRDRKPRENAARWRDLAKERGRTDVAAAIEREAGKSAE